LTEVRTLSLRGQTLKENKMKQNKNLMKIIVALTFLAPAQEAFSSYQDKEVNIGKTSERDEWQAQKRFCVDMAPNMEYEVLCSTLVNVELSKSKDQMVMSKKDYQLKLLHGYKPLVLPKNEMILRPVLEKEKAFLEKLNMDWLYIRFVSIGGTKDGKLGVLNPMKTKFVAHVFMKGYMQLIPGLGAGVYHNGTAFVFGEITLKSENYELYIKDMEIENYAMSRGQDDVLNNPTTLTESSISIDVMENFNIMTEGHWEYFLDKLFEPSLRYITRGGLYKSLILNAVGEEATVQYLKK
jgi:hypothetical protein